MRHTLGACNGRRGGRGRQTIGVGRQGEHLGRHQKGLLFLLVRQRREAIQAGVASKQAVGWAGQCMAAGATVTSSLCLRSPGMV